MNDTPFTTFKENEALATSDLFKEQIRDNCPQMKGRPFFLMLDHCPCPQCNTPIIFVTWRPFRDSDPLDNVLEYALWVDSELPNDLPRVLKVLIDGQEKQVCINHSKGVQ